MDKVFGEKGRRVFQFALTMRNNKKDATTSVGKYRFSFFGGQLHAASQVGYRASKCSESASKCASVAALG